MRKSKNPVSLPPLITAVCFPLRRYDSFCFVFVVDCRVDLLITLAPFQYSIHHIIGVVCRVYIDALSLLRHQSLLVFLERVMPPLLCGVDENCCLDSSISKMSFYFSTIIHSLTFILLLYPQV